MNYDAINASNIYFNKNLTAFSDWSWTVDFFVKKSSDDNLAWVLFNPTYTYRNFIDEGKIYNGHYVKLW